MKATLITGASSGIGEAFARRLAAEKHDLVLVARSEKALHELCDELMLEHKITAHYVTLDLTEADADERLFEETEKHGFEIAWLINNAGFGSYGDFAKLDHDTETRMIDLNIRSLVALTHRYLQGMRKRKSGTIINVSSAAGFQPIPFMSTYAATKAFVNSFSEAIAAENRPFGIQVMALCPGPTKTNFQAVARLDLPVEIKGKQTAEEVVEAALRGVKSGRTRIVSGFTNDLVSRVVNFVPNIVITRLMARALRSKYQEGE
ncbi:MAG: SDR family oxidoreductase [Chloracidobacterium sp.]|nr:SDR family oxidoreductase [Chloracidobacterium sp.]